MNITEVVANRSETQPADWEFADGPETGRGIEHWLVNSSAKLQAYVCIDQGDLVTCEITEVD